MKTAAQQLTAQSITVQDLRGLLTHYPQTILIDCREADEFKYTHIAGSVNAPISNFEQCDFFKIQKNVPVYVISHLEGRAKRAGAYLLAIGYEHVICVAGGLDAWSIHIDKKIPRY